MSYKHRDKLKKIKQVSVLVRLQFFIKSQRIASSPTEAFCQFCT